MDEIELKFLDIDITEIKLKLEKIGAQMKYDASTESFPFLSEGFHGSDSNKNIYE